MLGIGAAYAGSWWEYLRPSRPDVDGVAAAGSGRRGARNASSTGAPSTPLTRPLAVRRDAESPFADHRAIFVHLPKTAGTTFHSIMEREYPRAAIVVLYGDLRARVAELCARPEAELRAIRAVYGHFGTGLDELLPGPSALLTLLRDPVERVVSQYHYVRTHPEGQDHRHALEGVHSLEDFVLRSPLASVSGNQQTRLLGSPIGAPVARVDDAMFGRALAWIERDDVVVGVQERFDEFVLLACRAFGWGWPAYRPQNVGTGRPGLAGIPASTIDLIRERNAHDVVLHEAARGCMARELAEIPDLEQQLTTLRLAARWPGASPG